MHLQPLVAEVDAQLLHRVACLEILEAEDVKDANELLCGRRRSGCGAPEQLTVASLPTWHGRIVISSSVRGHLWQFGEHAP